MAESGCEKMSDKAIGGYFGLELCTGEHYHVNAIRLNTARNCFEYVLRTRLWKKVYVPYYTCEVMLELIRKLEVEFEFYHINEMLDPVCCPELKTDEAFLYTNYFGLKQNRVIQLAEKYGNQLIVDNAQAFYAKPIDGIDTFYSARKFFGVSDGAYLYTEKKLEKELEQDFSIERMSHLLKRIDISAEAGYMDFRSNDDSLCDQEIKRMSNLTEAILSGVDYEMVKQQRRDNFSFMDKMLKKTNLMHLNMDNEAVPMSYPYFTNDSSLKLKLIKNKVYVATYWPNVMEWCQSSDLEYCLAQNMLPIPIDQRYGVMEMISIVKLIDKL